MTATPRPKQAWDTSAYHRMTAARYETGDLVVEFEDGTRARVAAQALLSTAALRPNWSALVTNRYELVVPTDDGEIEIPWTSIRLLSDPAFDAHWRAMAAEEDRLIGARISELRQGQRMSVQDLALCAAVSAEALERIEAGHGGASLPNLGRILGAMGATFDDLILDPNPAASTQPTASSTS